MKTGDRVICVKTHEYGIVKKGQVFTILDMLTMGCGCVCVDVGIKSDSDDFTDETVCDIHNNVMITGNTYWLGIERFAPIQTKKEYISSDEFQDIEEKIDIPIPIETEI